MGLRMIATFPVPTAHRWCAVHGSASTIKYCNVLLRPSCDLSVCHCNVPICRCNVSACRCNVPLAVAMSFALHCNAAHHLGVAPFTVVCPTVILHLTRSTVFCCNVLAPVAAQLSRSPIAIPPRPPAPSTLIGCGTYLSSPLLMMHFHGLQRFGVLFSSLQGKFCILDLLWHLLTLLLAPLAVFSLFQHSTHPCARSVHPPRACAEFLCQQVNWAVLASLGFCSLLTLSFSCHFKLCTHLCVVDTSAIFTKPSFLSFHYDSAPVDELGDFWGMLRTSAIFAVVIMSI